MIVLSPRQVSPNLIALFDLDKPTMPRAFNVLEGVNRGQIVTDRPDQPTWAVVRDAVYGTLYFGGDVNAALVESLLQHFRQSGEVGIGCWLDDPFNTIIPPYPDYDGRTLYFTQRTSHKDQPLPRLPAGYNVKLRDELLFARSFDYGPTLEAFGSVQRVLEHTLGVVILHEDVLVCEAATGAPTHGMIEVGVTTAEAYRGQGLARIACARLIDLCEAKGYRTWWDCARQNIPSVRLARSLGYHSEREYRYVWWQKLEE